MARFWRQMLVLLLISIPSNALYSQTGKSTWKKLDGLWWVRVEGLSLFAPQEAKDKEIGMVLWKLAFFNDKLYLKQFVPSSDTPLSPSRGLGDLPFTDVPLRDLIVSDSFIGFKIKGVLDTYESFRLEDMTEDSVTGSYLAYNPYGPSGYGPEYRGKLSLTRIE
jgi:hypothetical protein